MTEALKLTIIEFCSLENSVSDAENIKEEHIFIDDNDHRAHYKCSRFLEDKVFKPYLGWNQEVYPKIKVKKVFLK